MNPVEFMSLWPEFQAPTWDPWRAVLGRLGPAVREFYVAAGRGSGKSRVAALLACCAAVGEYERAPGEAIYAAVIAPDRRQAGITWRYARELIRSRPELERLVAAETRGSLELVTGVVLEVVTASVAAPRGRSYALVVLEEAAFLPQDTSANPDVELLRAVRPGLARVEGSLLAVVSSPYARRGILWAAHQRARRGGDPTVVYVQKATSELNPSFPEATVDRALAEDPAGARAEYLAEFRRDVEGFVALEAVEAVTVGGRREVPLAPGVRYRGFVDFAGGSGQDSATLAVAHAEDRGGRRVAVLDLVREVRPPFSPEEVCREFAREMRRYGLNSAEADRYAADFATEAMRRHRVRLRPAGKAKSDLYRELLPLLNSRRVELLDEPRLAAQLVGLERRTARGGRDSIDHGPGGHDDMINAAAGALVLAAREPRRRPGLAWGRDIDPTWGLIGPRVPRARRRESGRAAVVSRMEWAEHMRTLGARVGPSPWGDQ